MNDWRWMSGGSGTAEAFREKYCNEGLSDSEIKLLAEAKRKLEAEVRELKEKFERREREIMVHVRLLERENERLKTRVKVQDEIDANREKVIEGVGMIRRAIQL